MAQAIINNLSINQDSITFSNDDNAKSSIVDFSKILDAQTSNITEESNNDIENTSSEISQFNNDLSKEISIAVAESSAETVIDLTIIENVFSTEVPDSETKDNTEEETATILQTEEETTTIISQTEKENPEHITITKEDPTMQNELTTLNDPISLTLLSTQQFFKPQIVTTENDSSTNEIIDNNLGDNRFENSSELKQFETLITKDSLINNNIIKNNVSNEKTDSPKMRQFLDEKVVKDLNIESISNETGENETSSDDLMQNQTPQEQAAKVMIQGDIKYEKISLEIDKTVNIKPTEVTPSKIIEQISKHLENLHNSSKLSIVLNPEKLGKVNIQILNSKDGITAQFTVATQDAKDYLMKGIQGLKESLLAHGINADNISVKLEETESEYHQDYNEQESSNNSFKHQNNKKQKEKDKKPFEQMMFEIENNDNLV